tara:strand:+ start:4662 stop:5546 length:885 start_codon:yes stop_codon:yes gene_type:complete
MRYTNKTGLPDPVVKALTEFESGEIVEGTRVTTLIDSPRISQLRQEHNHELTEDVSDLIYRVMGTAIHKVFENAASNSYVAEERLEHVVNGTMISGQVDLQYEDEDEVDLKDFKSTSTYKAMMSDHSDWERQLNVYAYLVRHAKGLKVRSATVIGVLRDWRKAEADRKPEYPPAPICEIDVPLWDEAEQDNYVESRVRAHVQADLEKEFNGLPRCSDAERWARPTRWAVYKGKNKRALRVFNSEEDAQSFCAEDDVRRVEKRPGEFTRCANNYCRVNQWCDQWHEVQNDREEEG